jgi:hypothetical protein
VQVPVQVAAVRPGVAPYRLQRRAHEVSTRVREQNQDYTYPAEHKPEQAAVCRFVAEPYVPAGHSVDVAEPEGQYEP